MGAEVTKEQQPNLPITPEELARDAAECEAAGAAIYHLHVRDERGAPTMEVGAFKRARAAIAEASDLIVQFTSGGAVTDTEQARIAPLELKPEMASLTTGTVNFGDEVFSNPLPLVRRFYSRMRELSVVPEFEIFDSGMIATAERLVSEQGDGHHLHYDLVLGVPGGMPAWPDAVPWLASKLPDDATWSATGIGRHNFLVAAEAIALGGHVRTGFEDVNYLERGVPADSNSQLVEKVSEMARDAGRELAGPTRARQILGL